MRAFGNAAEALISVDEAVARVLTAIQPLGTESVPLEAAFGRVLREEVVAAADVPPSDNSAMDGYAVRSQETPGTLRVSGDLPAGGSPTEKLVSGTAVRIMTGAPIPPGADAVAQVEITDGGSDVVTVHRAVAAGANVRRRGDDMRAGAAVLPAGVRLGPGEIGVAAAARRPFLTVSRQPVVAILATGDELRAMEEATGIVDSNSWSLTGLVAEAGAIPRRGAVVRDTLEATVESIEAALDADIIITTGGVSVGAFDYVKEAIGKLGATVHFWRVAMKPGKPVLFATVRDRIFFGLPGNPVSAMVAFTLFAGPAIRKALGQTEITAPVVRIRATTSLKATADRRTYLRVRVVARNGELAAEPMRAQGSHVATSMVQANGLAVVERDVEQGEMVPVMLIGPITGGITS